jgi:PAS domain S-box-containing protein
LLRAYSQKALILAPIGRDASIAAQMLAEASAATLICVTVDELVDALDSETGFALIAEEALAGADLRRLKAWIDDQPEWSDLPFILITSRGGGLERNPAATRYLETLGNVTFIERPFHPTTLVSLAQAALRGRSRQFDARARLEALVESEARFRAMADGASSPVWVTDHDGIAFVNQAFIGFAGIPADRLLGQGWFDIVHEDDRPAVLAARADAWGRQAPYSFLARFRGAGGKWYWFQASCNPRTDGQGGFLGYVGIASDVTEARRVEDELRSLNQSLEQLVEERTAALSEREARMRAIFESNQQYQWFLKADGTLLDANKAALAQIGMMRDAVAGQPFWETPWFAGDDEVATQVRIGVAAVAAGEDYRREITVPLDQGTRTLDLAMRPVRGGDGRLRGIVPEAVDITERRSAEEALRQSQKLEAMGQLTGGVAHDFNNLLAPIIGCLDLLQRNGTGNDRERRTVDGALQAADRAKVLVQRLLAFARRQPLQSTAVDIAALVRGMEGLIKTTIGAGIQLNIEAPEHLPPAKADTNQLEMALLNLCVNARDAMPKGGVLRIALSAERLQRAHPTLLPAARYVRLSIADTGLGMDEPTIERAIEPFFTTKGVGHGTGLGLSTVHGLALQLGGALTISSKPGLGTTIDLWLPVSEPTEEEPAATEAGGWTGSGRVLLADDDELVRASTASMLVDMGFEVIESTSGQDAVFKLKAGDRYSLLITDYMMPDLLGTEVAELAARQQPGLPILLITGYADADGLPAHLARLTKPFRMSELAERVAALLPKTNDS